MAERWRATSFSSMVTEWPFLLGADEGTLPLGSAVRYNLASRDGWSLSCGTFINNFRPCAEVENSIMKKRAAMNTRVLRPICVGNS